MPTKSPSTELATVDEVTENYPVVFEDTGEGSIVDLIEENLGGEALRATELPRYKVPSGGGKVWTSSDDEAAPAQTVQGVVVFIGTPRAYFDKSLEDRQKAGDDNKRPNCSSPDGKYGIGEFGAFVEDEATRERVPNPTPNPKNPTGECATCPLNQFGTSEKGAGKACKEREAWWILEKDAIVPAQVQVPASSKKGARQYKVGLTLKQKPVVGGVVTEFGLKKATNKAGTDYSEVTFAAVETLPKEAVAKFKAYGAQMKQLLVDTAYADAQADGDHEPSERPAADAWEGETVGPVDSYDEPPLDEDAIPEHLRDAS
jgi:hypothetical protein